jgi:hypothetical protein
MYKKQNHNALKHGAYAKDIVLPNESAEEFEQLRHEFRLQFNPVGEPQEAVVRELAEIQWVKNRLNQPLRQSFIHSELLVSEVGRWPMDLIVDYVKASMKVMASTREMALARADKIAEAQFALFKVTTSEEREKVLKAADQLAASTEQWHILLKGIMGAATTVQTAARDPLSQNVDVVLKLFEQLDRRYDKAVKRLVTLKEYDRLYGAKLIEQLPQAGRQMREQSGRRGICCANSSKSMSFGSLVTGCVKLPTAAAAFLPANGPPGRSMARPLYPRS